MPPTTYYYVPSLVRAALPVRDHAVLALEPFRALDAVELAQAREVLDELRGLVLFEVLGGLEVCGDLVEVSGEGGDMLVYYHYYYHHHYY